MVKRFILFHVIRKKDARRFTRQFDLDDPRLKEFQRKIDSGELILISSLVGTYVKPTYGQRGD